MNERKHCPCCGEDKLTRDFGLDRSRSDGLGFYCRACKNEIHRKTNAKRRHKIRAWERAHTTPCVDCGELVSDGYRKSRPSSTGERCDPCERIHKRERAIARARKMLALRAQGLLNTEIAERLGITQQSVANGLQRSRLREYGLLNERITSPYYRRNEDQVKSGPRDSANSAIAGKSAASDRGKGRKVPAHPIKAPAAADRPGAEHEGTSSVLTQQPNQMGHGMREAA